MCFMTFWGKDTWVGVLLTSLEPPRIHCHPHYLQSWQNVNLTFSVLSFPRLKPNMSEGHRLSTDSEDSTPWTSPKSAEISTSKTLDSSPSSAAKELWPSPPTRFPEDERKLSGPLQLEGSKVACCTHHNGLPASHVLTAGQRAHRPAGSQLRKEGVSKPGLLAFPDKDHSEPVASTQGPRPGWCYWFLWLSPNAQAALVWGGGQHWEPFGSWGVPLHTPTTGSLHKAASFSTFGHTGQHTAPFLGFRQTPEQGHLGVTARGLFLVP